MQYIIVIAGRCTKPVQSVPLRRIRSVYVAHTFLKQSIYKYGPPKRLLSNNRKQLIYTLFQSVFQLLEITNRLTSTFHSQKIGQVRRCTRTMTSMLCCYVNSYQRDVGKYASTLTYAYNSQVQRSTYTRPFDLVLIPKIPDFTL